MNQFMDQKSRDLIRKSRTLITFARQMNIKGRSLVLPVLFGVIAAGLEGIYVGLFYPLIKGLLYKDFKSILDIRVLGNFLKMLPGELTATDTELFFLLMLLLLAVLLAKLLSRYMSIVLLVYQIKKFTHNLRVRVFERFLSFGKLYFDRNDNARLYALLISFTSTIASRLTFLQNLVISLFTLAVYITIMLLLSWQLTLIMIAGIPLLHYASKGLISKIKKSSKDATEKILQLGNKALDVLTCIPLVKVYAKEESEKNAFRYQSDSARKFEFSMSKKEQLIPPLNELIQNIILLLLMGCVVVIVKDKGLKEVSKFIVFFILVRRGAAHMGVFSQFFSSMAMIAEPLKQVMEVFTDDHKFFVPGGDEEFCGLQNNIDIRDLQYSYIKGVRVINDVSLSIKKGEMVAIVGPTGSGKTTLVNILLRFYDCSDNTVFFDGKDVRKFSTRSLMRHMALVSQNTLIINDTIRKNIVYGLEGQAREGDIEKAIERAQLEDFIKKLPEGLDTVAGDQGIRLSGGEKQRIALARALLKPSEILILDEATSSLDSVTEKLVQKAIDAAVEGRTTLVIAHRLSTIKHADKIIVMEDGRITEQGTLMELLALEGKFHKLWEEQKFVG